MFYLILSDNGEYQIIDDQFFTNIEELKGIEDVKC